MNLAIEDVRQCLALAKELSEQYRVNAHCPRDERSVDDLLWLVRTYCEKQVAYNEVQLSAEDFDVKGLCLTYKDGHYEVFTLAELNDRERRLVASKELFHVVLDCEAKHNMDLLEHVQETQTSFKLDDSDPSPSVAVEVLAEIAALEFLFPYEERKAIVAAAGSLPIDHPLVARRFGIPQHVVEMYLTPQMMENFEQLEATGGW